MHAPPDIVESLHSDQRHGPPDIAESLHSDQRYAPPDIVESFVSMCMFCMESNVYGCDPRDCLMFSLSRVVRCSMKPFVLRWQNMFNVFKWSMCSACSMSYSIAVW